MKVRPTRKGEMGKKGYAIVHMPFHYKACVPDSCNIAAANKVFLIMKSCGVPVHAAGCFFRLSLAGIFFFSHFFFSLLYAFFSSSLYEPLHLTRI